MSKEIYPTLESQLFYWENWDEMDVNCLQFYDVELVVPIGEFPVGHKFPTAFFDSANSIVAFYDENNKETKFHLKISVGDQIMEKSE